MNTFVNITTYGGEMNVITRLNEIRDHVHLIRSSLDLYSRLRHGDFRKKWCLKSYNLHIYIILYTYMYTLCCWQYDCMIWGLLWTKCCLFFGTPYIMYRFILAKSTYHELSRCSRKSFLKISVAWPSQSMPYQTPHISMTRVARSCNIKCTLYIKNTTVTTVALNINNAHSNFDIIFWFVIFDIHWGSYTC